MTSVGHFHGKDRTLFHGLVIQQTDRCIKNWCDMSDWIGKLVHNFLLAWKSAPWRWALLVAGISDFAGLWVMLFPPAQWVLDVSTAVVLVLILGFRWPILSVMVIEAVPFLQTFPAWILVVVALAASNSDQAPAARPDHQ